jgi:cytochrome c
MRPEPRARLRPVLHRVLILALAGLASACASLDGGVAASSGAAKFGLEIADHACAGCHAIGLAGDSPAMAAPPFRDLRVRYNQLSFQRRMQEIAEGGHNAMPPLQLDPGEVRNLAAYIESLAGN